MRYWRDLAYALSAKSAGVGSPSPIKCLRLIKWRSMPNPYCCTYTHKRVSRAPANTYNFLFLSSHCFTDVHRFMNERWPSTAVYRRAFFSSIATFRSTIALVHACEYVERVLHVSMGEKINKQCPKEQWSACVIRIPVRPIRNLRVDADS